MSQTEVRAAMTAPFVHHVYFWLKRPGETADRDAIIAGLQKLRAAPDIAWSHIGVPAKTDRDVVDNSYAVSWLLVFDNSEAQDRYQDDPIHLQFIKDCAPYWSRVQVYDTLEI
jgi:hypothetical protein